MNGRLILPYPVSANRYWKPVTAGKRLLNIVTKEAKAFKTECGWRAKVAGFRTPVTHLIELELVLVPANGVCMDLDNCMKVAIDALNGVVWVDDSQVRKIVAERREPDGRARLEVGISAYVPPPAALFEGVPYEATIKFDGETRVERGVMTDPF